MSLELFPEGVALAVADDDGEPGPLWPEEERLAEAMSPRRRREFQSGRDCARRALHALGLPAAALPRGERRMPVWPAEAVGSITHTEGFCAAAAARTSHFAGVGLDAERLAPLSEGALARICSEAERSALAALPERDPAHWGAVVFSAKESLYKAYFPLTGVFLGFRDAAVELDPARERFRARLVRTDVPDAAGSRRFEGRYAIRGAVVVTGLALAR